MTHSVRRKVTFASLGLAGAAGLAALVLAGPSVAFADPSPSPSTSASAGAPTREDREARRAQRQDELAQALATELGIEKERVAAALEKVHAARKAEVKAERIAALKTRLDAAVAAGTLTQEQADAILKAAEAGVLPGGLGGRGHGRGPGR